ncbi:MAG: carbon storage regulator [Fuerstiella sp.]|nr:carbon storage regulator [Fuerstiella sp.]MCP4857837.1 carbon storage regulator [Fuerstiella sp.]
MLVLSRKPGESIQIDDNIFVTVSEVKGGRVRLSIEAPRTVRIMRQEVLERDLPMKSQELTLGVPVPAVKCMT